MSTISEAIIRDHRDLELHLHQVLNSPDNRDHQQRFGNQFICLLACHIISEELVVYPAFAKYLGSVGKEIAERDRQDHHEVKKMLRSFQHTKASDSNYVLKLKELWNRFSRHIRDEEEHALPVLEAELRDLEGESMLMAKRFIQSKDFVPSRAHPIAGEHPPFETVMSMLEAPVDAVADNFRKFPSQSESTRPSSKKTI